jgi:hypothetical protein
LGIPVKNDSKRIPPHFLFYSLANTLQDAMQDDSGELQDAAILSPKLIHLPDQDTGEISSLAFTYPKKRGRPKKAELEFDARIMGPNP